MPTPNIPKAVQQALKKAADPKTKATGERFFKEAVKLHGVKAGNVNKITKEYFAQVKDLDKKEIFALAEKLLQSGYSEEAWIAADWLARIHKQFTPGDFKNFERFLKKYIDNWAKCDAFCNHALGDFMTMYPQYIAQLKIWTQSPNRWLRRAAAVTLIIPAKRGQFLKDIFVIANKLLLDQDDLVQKGYGWLLKEASRQHQKEVFTFVIKNKARMPRTALRYAIEKMPDNLRKQAMQKP